jgi:hypothetical protein
MPLSHGDPMSTKCCVYQPRTSTWIGSVPKSLPSLPSTPPT